MAHKLISGMALAGALVAIAAGVAVPTTAAAHFVKAPCDFITSGGFVYRNDGGNVSFSADGGCKHEDFWGSLNVIDHNAKFHIKSHEITGYLYDPAEPNRRDICGWADTDDGLNVRFRVTLVDNGEPGRNDEFGIVMDTLNQVPGDRFRGFTGRKLQGGNVQLHKGNNSNTASAEMRSLQEWQMCGDLNSPR